MVGFIERLRKPKLPVVLGSPDTDGVVPQRTAPTSQATTPPVLRNFSYPTNILNSDTSSCTSTLPSTWDQLGEICSFTPENAPQTRRDKTAGLEDPFFYTTSRTPNKQPATRYEESDVGYGENKEADTEFLFIEKGWGKRHRRSTLLGLPSSQVQATSRF
ncbi:hypothetical protein F4808DRAFT_177832 [Astrocystis sublimbata]|nr:hypothetical protein F4808DRAFT_177832 [Astrocystis sublimbata]